MSDIPYDRLVEQWNECAERWKLARVAFLTESRQAKIRERWREWGKADPDGPEAFFIDALEAIGERPFYRGKNERGWKITFDYVFANDHNAVRLIEGKETEKRALRISGEYRDLLANIREYKGEKAYQAELARLRREQET